MRELPLSSPVLASCCLIDMLVVVDCCELLWKGNAVHVLYNSFPLLKEEPEGRMNFRTTRYRLIATLPNSWLCLVIFTSLLCEDSTYGIMLRQRSIFYLPRRWKHKKDHWVRFTKNPSTETQFRILSSQWLRRRNIPWTGHLVILMIFTDQYLVTDGEGSVQHCLQNTSTLH